MNSRLKPRVLSSLVCYLFLRHGVVPCRGPALSRCSIIDPLCRSICDDALIAMLDQHSPLSRWDPQGCRAHNIVVRYASIAIVVHISGCAVIMILRLQEHLLFITGAESCVSKNPGLSTRHCCMELKSSNRHNVIR